MFIIHFIENIINIIAGYSIWIYDIVTGRKSKRTQKRLEICNSCEHNKCGICEICGCVLKAKVRVDYDTDENDISIDGCPEQKW